MHSVIVKEEEDRIWSRIVAPAGVIRVGRVILIIKLLLSAKNFNFGPLA